MSLATYKKKRLFNKTPEPKGKKAASRGALHFVVQKHAASHLHYDFRLEMEGVLKSWAIPKGPSLNPEDKRLAMMVEDHPYDYKDFEGIIPPGNYGAGTVIVWDEGTYEPYEPSPKAKSAEKDLLHQLHAGNLKIVLHGKKLKGAFALVHTKGRGDNAWLLIKKKDPFVSTADITKKDKSVRSGLKLEKVAKESTHEWISNKKVTSKKKPVTAKPATTRRSATKKKAATKKAPPLKKKVPPAITALIHKGIKARLPANITPMLATLTDDPFDDKDWVFEIKWDGYRAVAHAIKGKVKLESRNNISFAEKFHPVAEALEQFPIDVVLDGEIVAVNDDGRGDFQLLQQWQKTGAGELIYYVFDLLWIDGYDIRALTLAERKEILRAIVPETGIIRYSDHITGKGNEFYNLAVKQGLEGIMAKHAESPYTTAIRTKQWLKIKTHQRQEVVIGGFTQTRGSRKHFGALVLGVYEKDELIYVGHTGTGFTEESLTDVYKLLKPLIITTCPFRTKPKTNMPCTWVKPKLVCEIRFSEWTKDNIMRIPVFMGLRQDKSPKEVTKEKAIHANTQTIEKEIQPAMKTAIKKKAAVKKAVTKKTAAKKAAIAKSASQQQASNTSLLNESDKEQVVIINKKELTFTNLDKLYWPKEKISKRDLINYYHEVAPYILPYLKDRPQSLNRLPNGITKPGFYQKDVGGKVADWIETHDYVSESDGETKKFLVCTDEAALLYMANLGCIEMNPWHSTTKHPENPNWCVIDLDPGKISFEKVIEAALVVKEVADNAGIDSYCKTSGSTGLHIYIPLGTSYTYDQSRQLAELLVTLVHQEIPSFTSLERSPAKRKNKIYLDFLQNRTIQTIAAPYSVRPKPGATASAPLHWEEVKSGLKVSDFHIGNMLDRIKDAGDIFKPVLGKGINLKKALETIGKM
jgi:bifunctional non-homologous end joining protein LigD